MHQANANSRTGKRIPVDHAQPLALTVHSHSGDVAVRAVDRPDVQIWYDEDDDEGGLMVDARGNRIEVRPNLGAEGGWTGVGEDFDLESVVGQITKAFRGGGSFFSAKPGKARIGSSRHSPDIAIEVPRSITGRVEVNCASGDVSIEGFTGEIALNTMSGDVRAAGTTGALTLQTASGDLLVKQADGRLTARTANGDVRIVSSQSDGFDVKTASGDVHLDAMVVGDGASSIQTASGDVRLTLRRPAADGAEPAAVLAFRTVSGDAHVSAPFRKTDRQRWLSGAGDRAPSIEVSTVNGDLTATIASAGDAHGPAPSPAVFVDEAPPAQESAERLAVLEAVERGEIDVEEALRRLDAEEAVANP